MNNSNPNAGPRGACETCGRVANLDPARECFVCNNKRATGQEPTQRDVKPLIVSRDHLRESIKVCQQNTCGNYGTRDGRTGCLLLAKPCGIERHLLAGGGCLSDPPVFKPYTRPAHAFAPAKGARFITAAQLQRDVLQLVGMIPDDVGAIAGVARSGMGVASMLAMYLHLPLLTVRQSRGDVIECGNGWRLSESKHLLADRPRVLVIDDTVMTGNSFRAITAPVRKRFGNKALTAAIYVNPGATKKPDLWLHDLAWPHLLEWNLFNSVLSNSAACDFDGVLCRDCTPADDDDGPRYQSFIEHARPLYVPRKRPIPLIVTARIERYRAATEQWLRRHGIRWDRLIMHPAPTLAERNGDNIARYKANAFRAWARDHIPNPAPLMFIESDDRQAQHIAAYSGRLTVCPSSAKCYEGTANN